MAKIREVEAKYRPALLEWAAKPWVFVGSLAGAAVLGFLVGLGF